MRQVDNGDYLEGVLYEMNGNQYLQVSKIKRKDKGDWVPVEGEQWMPDSGGPSNGGQWLHPIKAPAGSGTTSKTPQPCSG